MHILLTVLHTFHVIPLGRIILFKDQDISSLLIILFILITCMFYEWVILWGEIRFRSLLGLKGLTLFCKKKKKNAMVQIFYNGSYTMMAKPIKTLKFRASDNSREKKWNFAGFEETNSRRKRPISREFRGNFRGKFSPEKQTRKQKRKIPVKIWKGCQIQGKKRNTKFIQHSSEGKYLFRATRKTYKALPKCLASFFSCNLEPKTATQ